MLTCNGLKRWCDKSVEITFIFNPIDPISVSGSLNMSKPANVICYAVPKLGEKFAE